MTKDEKIKVIYKDLSPIFDKYSSLSLLPLRYSDLKYIKDRSRLDRDTFYYSDNSRMEVKKNRVSPSLFLAANIISEQGNVIYADKVRKVLEDLIKLNPKKYYRK